MKISRKWLEDYVDIDVVGLDTSALAGTLTMLGLMVELVEEVSGDTVLDVDITTNRPDCLNHWGIAREIAAYYRLDLKHPDWGDLEADSTPEESCSPGVRILDADLCSRYAARVMSEVAIGESPDWLKDRLESIGQRPINNIVDITNYVLFELGHPLHAFDYHRLADRQIVVRRARTGETLTTLDGIERKLREDMLVIADASQPVALAGIMGGADSEIAAETKVLLLESAWFQPSAVRSTAGSLGMRTEASYRFERGADPEMPVRALNRACRLIKEVAGGHIIGPLIDEYPRRGTFPRIQLRKERIVQVSGVEIDGPDVEETLRRLEFDVESSADGSWTVRSPSFRHDIELEDDLVEEVVRHFGYDRIPVVYPRPEDAGRFQEDEPYLERVISLLKGNGFWEAMNLVFTTPDQLKPFFGDKVSALQISNPLSEADTHLRTSLVPGIVESLKRNLYHGNQDVRLFEIGNVFFPGEDGQHREERRLAVGAMGDFYSPYWRQDREGFHFLHLKGILEQLFESFGISIEFSAADSDSLPYLHPGMSARILDGGAVLGSLGALHPLLGERFKFSQPVLLAEVDLEGILSRPLPQPTYQSLSRFPEVTRDLSFLVDKNIGFSTIKSAVQVLKIVELKDFQLIDLYQGSHLPEGKISLTVRLTFVDPSRTLTQEEVNDRSEQVFSALRTKFAIEPRA